VHSIGGLVYVSHLKRFPLTDFMNQRIVRDDLASEMIKTWNAIALYNQDHFISLAASFAAVFTGLKSRDDPG